MITKQQLIDAGLPCDYCTENGEIGFTRPLNDSELKVYEFVVNYQTAEEKAQALGLLVRQWMDETIKVRDYQYGIDSACTYALSAVPSWKTEGETLTAWRDAVWAHVYSVMAAFQAGERTIPMPDELIAELPILEWPAQ